LLTYLEANLSLWRLIFYFLIWQNMLKYQILLYSAPTVWNNLPSSIRSFTSSSKFKSCMKAHCFTLAYENASQYL